MSSNAFKKLAPEVRRELLRHVKPSAAQQKVRDHLLAKHQRLENAGGERSKSAKKWMYGCIGFVGLAASMPYFLSRKIGNLTARDDPLTAAQVRRGAFMNSGSRDAGKDRNWDLSKGVYVYPEGFAKHLSLQDPNQTDLGPDLGPAVRDEQKQRSSSSSSNSTTPQPKQS